MLCRETLTCTYTLSVRFRAISMREWRESSVVDGNHDHDSKWRCLTSIGNSIVEIRRHLYIKSGPSSFRVDDALWKWQHIPWIMNTDRSFVVFCAHSSPHYLDYPQMALVPIHEAPVNIWVIYVTRIYLEPVLYSHQVNAQHHISNLTLESTDTVLSCWWCIV